MDTGVQEIDGKHHQGEDLRRASDVGSGRQGAHQPAIEDDHQDDDRWRDNDEVQHARDGDALCRPIARDERVDDVSEQGLQNGERR